MVECKFEGEFEFIMMYEKKDMKVLNKQEKTVII